MLDSHLLECADDLVPKECTFMQDNTLRCTEKKTKEWFLGKNINVLPKTAWYPKY